MKNIKNLYYTTKKISLEKGVIDPVENKNYEKDIEKILNEINKGNLVVSENLYFKTI